MLESDSFEIILADIKCPNGRIGDVKKIKLLKTDSIIIVMTAFATVDTAVQALKDGAFDYVQTL